MYRCGCGQKPRCMPRCFRKCVGEFHKKFRVYKTCCIDVVCVCHHCGCEYEHHMHHCCPRCGCPRDGLPMMGHGMMGHGMMGMMGHGMMGHGMMMHRDMEDEE